MAIKRFVANMPRRMNSLAKGEKRMVVDPNETDILCGKGKAYISHVGTQRFRSVIESHRKKYHMVSTKQEKMKITKEIYEIFCCSSTRFLKWNEYMESWQELSPLEARDKISHAIRFANKDLEKSTFNNKTNSNIKGLGPRSLSPLKNDTILELRKEEIPLWNCFLSRQQAILESIKTGKDYGWDDTNFSVPVLKPALPPQEEISGLHLLGGDEDVLPLDIQLSFDKMELEWLLDL